MLREASMMAAQAITVPPPYETVALLNLMTDQNSARHQKAGELSFGVMPRGVHPDEIGD